MSIGTKLLEISSDGCEIYYKSIKYSLKNLPNHAEKIYRYAEQCLNTIRSKTPNIVIEDKEAKYLLMSNMPNPNFEAEFRNGIKVFYQVGKEDFVIFKDNEETHVNLNDEGNWKTIIQITLQGLKSCIKGIELQTNTS